MNSPRTQWEARRLAIQANTYERNICSVDEKEFQFNRPNAVYIYMRKATTNVNN